VAELAQIMDGIRQELTTKNQVRDNTLNRSRELIRFCALSIRAIHRHDWDEAADGLKTARDAAQVMVNDLGGQPDLYYTGYTQDALKELVEAHTLYAFVRGGDVPGPAELSVPSAAYLNGLAEAASELRRFILDLIRRGETRQGEPYLTIMDDVYARLIAMDFPDSLTGGLRRTTDALRAVLERTVGDLTVSMRQEELQAALRDFEQRMTEGRGSV
jgi:translin